MKGTYIYVHFFENSHEFIINISKQKIKIDSKFFYMVLVLRVNIGYAFVFCLSP